MFELTLLLLVVPLTWCNSITVGRERETWRICQILFRQRSPGKQFVKFSLRQSFPLYGSWICQSSIVQSTFNSMETFLLTLIILADYLIATVHDD